MIPKIQRALLLKQQFLTMSRWQQTNTIIEQSSLLLESWTTTRDCAHLHTGENGAYFLWEKWWSTGICQNSMITSSLKAMMLEFQNENKEYILIEIPSIYPKLPISSATLSIIVESRRDRSSNQDDRIQCDWKNHSAFSNSANIVKLLIPIPFLTKITFIQTRNSNRRWFTHEKLKLTSLVGSWLQVDRVEPSSSFEPIADHQIFE